MYESFFGFVKRPFLAVSTLDRYFPASSIEQTLQTASRAIQRGEGPVAIFGGTGLGKTMCCLRIAENFRRNFEVVMLASSQLITRRALLQSLLYELRMPYREMSEGELRLTLMNRLQPSTENPSDGLVLIVDEAQTLSTKLLEELRLLTNIVRSGIPRVRLILCGTLRLEELLSNPNMESLSQRLAARCYLTPLTPQETAQYVKHKMELCGVECSTVMTRDALEAIYRGSDGIPRLIDQLADQALMLACSEREKPVSAAMIGRAWCMLQQLPNPWSEPETMPKSMRTSFTSPAASMETMETHRVVSNPTSDFKITVQSSMTEVPQKAVSASPFVATAQPQVAAATPAHIHVAVSSPSTSQSAKPSMTTPSVLAPTRVKETFQPEVEFGALDEELTLEPEKPSVIQGEKKKNLLDAFAGDFDEEFSIPVQSSSSYQAYSGIAYGNLNYDLSSFGAITSDSNFNQESIPVEELRELPPVATPRMSQPDSPYMSPIIESQYFDTISNISPEQAANLERQIEEEMRELVSGLNLSAMTFDPASKIDMFAVGSDYKFEAVEDPKAKDSSRYAHGAHSDVISFSGLSKDDVFASSELNVAEVEDDVPSINDDRDILIIENEIETMRSGAKQSATKPTRAVMHPYAKLFSKLRNS